MVKITNRKHKTFRTLEIMIHITTPLWTSLLKNQHLHLNECI